MACETAGPLPGPGVQVARSEMSPGSAWLPQNLTQGPQNIIIFQGCFENQFWTEIGNPDHNVISSMSLYFYVLGWNPLTFVLKWLVIKKRRDPGMNWVLGTLELSKLFPLSCSECNFQFLKNPNKVINVKGRRLDLSLFLKWWHSRKIADWGKTRQGFMLTQRHTA